MLKSAFRVIACIAPFVLLSFPQEIALSSFPEQMRNPISDAVLYRLFLEHTVAFERQALLNEAQGKSGDAFRNHLKHQFILTAEGLSVVSRIASDLQDQLDQLRSEQRAAATRFRTEHFESRATMDVRHLPPITSALLTIENRIDALGLQSRDRIKATLPDLQFAKLNSRLHARDSFHKEFDEMVKHTTREKATSTAFRPLVYAYSSIDSDPVTGQVTAYAETEIDGTLLPYYEPALTVTINDQSRLHDFASACPKPAGNTFVCQFAAASSSYIISTEHVVNLTVQNLSSKNSRSNQWVDALDFKSIAGFDLTEPFELQFSGRGPAHSVSEPSIILGATCIWSNWNLAERGRRGKVRE